MKAVIIEEARRPGVREIPELKIRPDYIKIKTVAVAVNPTDFHHGATAGPIGGILGCDLSGVVEQVGENCKSDVTKGDRVYGVCHCANLNYPESGSFAEFALVKDGHIAKLPQNVTFEEAATLGTGLTAVGQALYMIMQLPLPTKPAKEPYFILISGGSSATGTLAIQFAKLSGLRVVTTASPNHFDLVKSLGAEAVFDYHDPECGKKIREYTNNSLQYAFDAISVESSFKICEEAFPLGEESLQEDAAKKLHLVTQLPMTGWTRKDVDVQTILAYTTFGEAFSKFGTDFPPLDDHFKFGVMFWALAAKLLAEGKIKTHPVLLRPDGLQGVPAGIAEVNSGTVRAAKLVYRVAETPQTSEHKEKVILEGASITSW